MRSKTSSAQPDVEFLVDRSLGSRRLPEALSNLGFTVHTLASLYGSEKVAQGIADEEWLSLAGNRGYAVLMKDAVHRVKDNRYALERHSAKAFCLTNRHLTGAEQCERILDNLNRILQRSRKPGPFVYGIYKDGLRKLWPRP